MSKNVIQDVVPPEKKSIRSIPVPDRSLRSRFASSRNEGVKTSDFGGTADFAEQFRGTTNDEEPKSKRPVIIGFSIVGILVAGFFLMNFFQSTTVKIVRHTEPLQVDNLTVDVPYGAGDDYSEILSIEEPIGSTVPASEEEYVKTKASGTIIVYNNFTSSSQKLIKNTRFEAPNGNIYRIMDSIVIPGITTKDGKKVPGSIEVTVYADSEGDNYNIGMVDFTIPGFKGTPQYDGFYARSKTNMEGGFDGVVKKVAEGDKNKAISDMKSSLKDSLESKLNESLPDDYVYFDNLVVIEYTDLPQSDIKDDSVQLNLSGKLSVPIFKEVEFTKAIANKVGNVDSSDPFLFKDASLLNVETNQSSYKSTGTLTLIVNGVATLEWQVDENKVKMDLAGKDRKDILSVFATYKSIERAKAYISPFWKSALPENADKIRVEFVDIID